MNVPHTSVWRVLHDQHLHPYHRQKGHAMGPADFVPRANFCAWFLDQCSSRPKKVSPTQSAVKVMFIVAYDIDGVILHHAVPPKQTANADYYCRFLQHHLCPALRRKRRHLGEQPPIRTPGGLWDRVLNAWEEMAKNLDLFHNIVDSMPLRMRAVVDTGGLWTRY
ncbi:hypothetical protein ANN_08655 [Periplaneta americana]|uniref:Uncharacterized protein n=1 Tax=Periplaneta americana TaxID=6978 RepID=A0ABQ8T209_PERAM|nr:hypothetical protein ANN_08655 [Periplaneta americana]